MQDSDRATSVTCSPVTPSNPSEGYSIRVVARITGISVDTLRIWERRYGLPTPVRNATGNRVYGEDDVQRLVLVARALKMGVRAGDAIRMDVGSLTRLVADMPTTHSAGERSVDMVDAILSMAQSGDLLGLQRLIERAATIWGGRHFVRELVTPLLEKVGAAWAQGELALYQEHLITEALLWQLKSLSRHQELPSGPRVLLATLPRETHALGLEMARVIASACGANVFSLGTDCPPREVVRAASDLRVQAVGISVSTASAPNASLGHIQLLAEQLAPSLPLWLGGGGATQLTELPNRAIVIAEWQDLEDAIRGLARGL